MRANAHRLSSGAPLAARWPAESWFQGCVLFDRWKGAGVDACRGPRLRIAFDHSAILLFCPAEKGRNTRGQVAPRTAPPSDPTWVDRRAFASAGDKRQPRD